MTENDKAIEFLTRMGDLLYGRDWIVPLGREMEISPDLIFNWISRKTPLTMSDDVWPNVFYVLGQRGNRYQDFIDEVYFAFRDARENQGKWWEGPEDYQTPAAPSVLDHRRANVPGMCNLYSITSSQSLSRALASALHDITGNMPPLPGVFPDYVAPIARNTRAPVSWPWRAGACPRPYSRSRAEIPTAGSPMSAM